MPEPKKIFFAALGCPKNQVDGELMLGSATAAGHEVVDDPSLADVLVVNTCAFISEAREESVDTICELARFKESGEGKRLVVSGCMAQRYADELGEAMPEIDAFVGTGALDSFTEALGEGVGALGAGEGAGGYRGPAHYLPTAAMDREIQLRAIQVGHPTLMQRRSRL